VNCASTTSEILNSELFGSIVESSFGIISEKPGKFELANHGIILLDNIDQMPLDIQFKLLQFIDDNGFYIKNNKTVKTDVQIIATISKSIKALNYNQFSKALYFRLNSFSIKIPPLRDRKTDIPILANYFISLFNNKYKKNIKKIPLKYISMLSNYSWPGNVREFKNIIENSVIISNNTLLKLAPFEKIILNNEEEFLSYEEFERDYLIRVLKKTKWRISGPNGASIILKMHPETLRSKMKKLNISKPKSLI
jgi:DNA-binding NtrC family response regulator